MTNLDQVTAERDELLQLCQAVAAKFRSLRPEPDCVACTPLMGGKVVCQACLERARLAGATESLLRQLEAVLLVASAPVRLSAVFGAAVVEVTGHVSREFSDLVFQLDHVVLADGRRLPIEGEHDLPYVCEETEGSFATWADPDDIDSLTEEQS